MKTSGTGSAWNIWLHNWRIQPWHQHAMSTWNHKWCFRMFQIPDPTWPNNPGMCYNFCRNCRMTPSSCHNSNHVYTKHRFETRGHFLERLEQNRCCDLWIHRLHWRNAITGDAWALELQSTELQPTAHLEWLETLEHVKSCQNINLSASGLSLMGKLPSKFHIKHWVLQYVLECLRMIMLLLIRSMISWYL